MKKSSKILSSGELMDKIIDALDHQKPLSVISIGATESYVMAQYNILSEKEFMSHPEAVKTNKGKRFRGFKFPNIELRDQLIKGAQNAHIVGYCMSLRNINAGLMAEKVLKVYRIQPEFIYDALVRRVIMYSQKEKFTEMLKGRKILLISSMAKQAKKALNKKLKKKLRFDVVDTINIESFNEIEKVKEKIGRRNFDLCLITAGVNAVILAPYIAEVHGKVAFDLGQGMSTLITGDIRETAFVKEVGLNRLMSM